MKVLQGQGVIDIAIQECGSLESIFDVALKNGISITDELSVAQEVSIPEKTDPDIASHYRNRMIRPRTYPSDDEVASTISEEGIGAWAIEEDFVVS
jgi:hypothetical protein